MDKYEDKIHKKRIFVKLKELIDGFSLSYYGNNGKTDRLELLLISFPSFKNKVEFTYEAYIDPKDILHKSHSKMETGEISKEEFCQFVDKYFLLDHNAKHVRVRDFAYEDGRLRCVISGYIRYFSIGVLSDILCKGTLEYAISLKKDMDNSNFKISSGRNLYRYYIGMLNGVGSLWEPPDVMG